MYPIAEIKGMHLLGKENRHGRKKRVLIFNTSVLVWSLGFEHSDITMRKIDTVLFLYKANSKHLQSNCVRPGTELTTSGNRNE